MLARRSRWRRRLAWLAVAGLLLPVLGWLLLPLTPMPEGLFAPPPPSLELLDREGRPLRLARQGDSPFQQRVPYAGFPPALIHATLAAEDARFWSHPGLEWRGILRASWHLARHRRIVSGGSTITQQLVKQAAPRPRTFPAKALEAARALRLEQLWDKQRILGEYLHRVDYGNFLLGAPAAARFYFDQRVEDLSPAQCALLAALPQAPSRLNPLRQPERARQRQQWILGQMLRRGWLTESEHDRALREPLRLVGQRAFAAPHFADFAVARLSKEELPQPATAVRTTLDLPLNDFAARSLRRQLDALRPRNARDGAVVVLDNRGGDVLALVGSADYFASEAGQVNGAWAARSAGSAFKPFTYALALEQGATPATVIADTPVSFATTTGVFAPQNYDRQFRGPVSLRAALAGSLNIPAVRMLDETGGPGALLERLRACGLTTLDRPAEHYGLGLTIGNAEARLLELANAYACLARLGVYRPWRVLASPAREAPEARRVFDAGTAWLIADILSDNAARAEVFGLDSALRFDFPVACKTGTSTAFRDNWAFGYTPEFTVGVWVGNFDGSPMREVSGVSGAAPVLREVFLHLRERFGTSWHATPADLVEAPVHRLTGKRLSEDRLPGIPAALVTREKFLPPHLPPVMTDAEFDPQGRARLPAEYAGWLLNEGQRLAEAAGVEAAASAVRITFPPPGTTLFLDADLPEHGTRLGLSAEGGRDLRWSSPTLAIEQTGPRPTAHLRPGRHEFNVRDAQSGATAATWIEVRGEAETVAR